MPAPRGEDPGRNGDKWTGRMHIQAAAIPSARTYTEAEAQRRYRAGVRPGRGPSPLLWSAPRNGLPVRPYVYRGTGADAITGEVVQ